MEWEEFDKNLKPGLYKLWNRLTSGSYYPMPVKEVIIAKKQGGERRLGVPTLSDRIAQQVVRQYLEPIAEPKFHEQSYGYRPGKSSHQAVYQACQKSFNHDFVIDLDIASFFDTIDRELLMKTVQYFCKERWILLYIRRWLEAGILGKDGETKLRMNGTPQGGVISPLLANMFLHVVFDKWMAINHPEKPFERYADDIVVHCKTEKQAKFMLAQITRRLKQCKLEVNGSKTRIVNLRGTSE